MQHGNGQPAGLEGRVRVESEASEATVSGNSLSRMASGRSGLKSLISSVCIKMAGATENESSLSLSVSDQSGGLLIWHFSLLNFGLAVKI